jgi:phosphoribosylformylglycinamidine (FGAM) synthase-like enzyme
LLGAVPQAAGIGPYALLLSETQERMLVAVEPHHLDAVLAVLRSYSRLLPAVIGQVGAGTEAVLKQNGESIACLPVDLVVDGFPRIQINELAEAGIPHTEARQ